MTPEHIARVQTSWRAIGTDAAALVTFTETFYDRLFALAPDARELFETSLEAQKHKLAVTLDAIVEHLDNPTVLRPTAQALGVRHSGYGVQDRHYELARQALLQAAATSVSGTLRRRHRTSLGRGLSCPGRGDGNGRHRHRHVSALSR